MAHPDSFRTTWHQEEVLPNVAAKQIIASERSSSIAKATPTEATYRRVFVNDERNSRLATPLPQGEWDVSRIAKLGDDTRPRHLLLTDKRVVLEGEGPWDLFDHDLHRISFGYRTGGGMTIDAEHDLMFFPDTAGLLKACQLSDGKFAFSVPLTLGEAFEPDFVVRRGHFLLVKSSEQMLDLHDTPPEMSSVEVIDLGNPLELDAEGFLLSALSTGDLQRDTLHFFPAMSDEHLVIASEARVYVLDMNLSIQSVLQGDFLPAALSLDETGRIYLIAHLHDQAFLWLLSLEGERLFETLLPAELLPGRVPPLITHSHEVILLSRNRVFKYAEDGLPFWECKPKSPIVGGVLTGDDTLLLAAGSELFAFSSEGHCQLLYTFKEPLQTPPALAPDGAIFIATGTTLYRLEAWDVK